jgi:predicted alpha/beta-hydrolase family hydrolase
LLLACMLAGPARSAEQARALHLGARQALLRPAAVRPTRALLVLAHGQIMNIHHPFMEAMGARSRAPRHRDAALQLSYAEAKRNQPTRAAVVASIQAAAREGERLRRGCRCWWAGSRREDDGRAGGARRLAASAEGVVVLGYRCPPGRPSGVNARAVVGMKLPILFVQGTRDPLADPKLITGLVEQIGRNATLHQVRDADHAFALPEGGARAQEEVYEEMADAIASFAATLAPSHGG